LEAVNLVGFVAFFWLVQSQAHAGAASTIAAEKNPQRLILADFFFKIGPGIIIDSNHDLNSYIKRDIERETVALIIFTRAHSRK
jgi:hypothetical protein